MKKLLMTSHRRLIISTAYVCAALVCTSAEKEQTPRTPLPLPSRMEKLPDQMQIRMACYADVMRILKEHQEKLGYRELQGLFFLSVNQEEEPEISKLFPGVRVKSARHAKLENRRVVDRDSGERGVLLEVKSVTIRSAAAAEAYVGHFSGAATMYEMRLSKTNSIWVVSKSTLKLVE